MNRRGRKEGEKERDYTVEGGRSNTRGGGGGAGN
jgi:hypothetical protein